MTSWLIYSIQYDCVSGTGWRTGILPVVYSPDIAGAGVFPTALSVESPSAHKRTAGRYTSGAPDAASLSGWAESVISLLRLDLVYSTPVSVHLPKICQDSGFSGVM